MKLTIDFSQTVGKIKPMNAVNNEPVDMLMYYDARANCIMNGLFSVYTLQPLKGYYPIKTWGEMLAMGNQVRVASDIPDVYATAAKGDEDGLAMVTYYTDDDNALPLTFTVELQGMEDRPVVLHLLDGDHYMEQTQVICPDNGKFQLTMQANTVAVIR